MRSHVYIVTLFLILKIEDRIQEVRLYFLFFEIIMDYYFCDVSDKQYLLKTVVFTKFGALYCTPGNLSLSDMNYRN